jgi:CRP-like cAMP-binding protein
VTYRHGDHVYQQGDFSDAAFRVESGAFALVAVCPDGKHGIVGIARAGSFFGECCLKRTTRECTAFALEEGRVERLPKTQLAQLLTDHSFARGFVDHLLARNSGLQQRLLDHLFCTSEERLARILLDLSNPFGRGYQPIAPRPSHEMLAAIVGTTRPRISQFMQRFQRLGYVTCRKTSLEIHESMRRAFDQDQSGDEHVMRNATAHSA